MCAGLDTTAQCASTPECRSGSLGLAFWGRYWHFDSGLLCYLTSLDKRRGHQSPPEQCIATPLLTSSILALADLQCFFCDMVILDRLVPDAQMMEAEACSFTEIHAASGCRFAHSPRGVRLLRLLQPLPSIYIAPFKHTDDAIQANSSRSHG